MLGIMNEKMRTTVKICLVAVISLLLLIPLLMVIAVIDNRAETGEKVVREVENAYAEAQTVRTPSFESILLVKDGSSEGATKEQYFYNKCEEVNIDATVETETLHRSIYDVIVYRSKIALSGKFKIGEAALKSASNAFKLQVSDLKGLCSLPELRFGGKTLPLENAKGILCARIELPENAKVGDLIDFSIEFDLKGTGTLAFQPNAGQTNLAVKSSHPHPSFQGAFLPDKRVVRDDGFEATWRVSDFNVDSYSDSMEIRFVDLANPYQQAMRSAKYGILIIIFVFVATLFVEFLTRKEINPVQYAVVGLSLVLFYSLLIAFSEFIPFGIAYLIAALMTVLALTIYFKAMFKGRGAGMLGGFVALVYVLNYVLLQMETYALLAGSLVLFFLLCVVMYLTANINDNKEA